MSRVIYKINENYFEKIDSPEKAYFLGWLLSDGYNSESTGEVSIRLQEKDKDVLILLRDLIGSNHPLKLISYKGQEGKENWSDQYGFRFSRKKISNDLAALGMVQAKSKILQFPVVEEIYYKPLIRGIFEGDGCFSFSKRNKAVVGQFNICSASKEFINSIILYISDVLGLNLILRQNSWGVYYAATSGNNNIKKIMSWIYSDDLHLKLNRKYENYQAFLKADELRKSEILEKSNRKCCIEGCDLSHWGKGFCKKHHWQYWAYDDPLFDTKREIIEEIVYQYDLKGNFIKKWEFLVDAAREIGTEPCHIRDCLDLKNRRAGNFQWRSTFFEKIEFHDKYTSWNCRKVQKLSLGGDIIEEYLSLDEAARKNDTSSYFIQRCINGKIESLKNNKWKFK